MFSSLRDELMGRMEAKAAAREATAESACLEAQETLTEELEERLRKHWPRKGRMEVSSVCVAAGRGASYSRAFPLVECSVDRSVCLARRC